MKNWRVALGSAAALVCICTKGAWVQAQSGQAYVPGEMIVKYAEVVLDSVPRIIDSGGFTEAFEGAPTDTESGLVPGQTLDAIHGQIGLYEVKSLFLDRSNLANAEAQAKQQEYYETLAEKFPQRAARGDLNAIPNRMNTYMLRFDENVDVEALSIEYGADPVVEWAEPNWTGWELHDLGCPPPAPTCTLPNDPYLSTCGAQGISNLLDLWDLYAIEAPEGWCTNAGQSSGGARPVIAILDTGVDYTHFELRNNLYLNSSEDRNNIGTFEPWNYLVQQGVCEGGNGHRSLCNSNPSCPTSGGFACHASDTCTCRYGDFDGCDGVNTGACPDENGYVDDVVGYDFFADDPNAKDGVGHGTMVAGKAAGIGNNNVGVLGSGHKAQILPIKLFGEFIDPFGGLGEATAAEMAEAVDYAVANGTDIMNMSFGSPDPDYFGHVLEDALDAAFANGVVSFAASGNGGAQPVGTPARIDSVIAVGGSNENDEKVSFASYGSELDVVAPAGSDEPDSSTILGLLGQGSQFANTTSIVKVGTYYMLEGGTSFSSPTAAGLAALLLAVQGVDPSTTFPLTPSMVRHALRGTADDLENVGFDNLTGRGRVNARAAMELMTGVPAGTLPTGTNVLPVEVRRGTTPWSRVVQGGSPPDQIDHYGEFHKPASWNIDPRGKQVVLRIEDKNGVDRVVSTIPATSTQCNGSGNPPQCFKLRNDGGYEYTNASAPFGGITEIRMSPATSGSTTWDLIIHGKNMSTSPYDVEAVFLAPDYELTWTVEIADRPWLRSTNLRYLLEGGSNNKLKHPT